MSTSAPPRIFSPHRRTLARQRMLRLQQHPDAPRYLIDDMVEDVLERLAFLRHTPRCALVIGDYSGTLAPALAAQGCDVEQVEPAFGFDEEKPHFQDRFDLVVSLGTLDTVNDLPGALIHLRRALAAGGLLVASLMASGCLPVLREAMLAADGDRPAPRLHPAVDVRAGGQLLQRTGFADPVIDQRSLDVRFSSLARMIADLRAMALTNVLTDPGPALTHSARTRAERTFDRAEATAGTTERFEILTLSGWSKDPKG